MARNTASVNPKITFIRQIAGKLAPTARRYFAEVGRAQPSPASASALTADMENSLTQIIRAELRRSGLPFVTPEEAAPQEAHWLYQPLQGRRNVEHGRLPFSTTIAYVDDTGKCTLGAVYFPLEDVLVLAEEGLGSTGNSNHRGDGPQATGRFRVGGRQDLTDSLLALPWSTADLISMKLLEKTESANLHTRKTGHTLFDVIDVAAGRADVMVATRLNRLEALLAPLILSEAGAAVSTLEGKSLTATSKTLVSGNMKLHGQFLKAIN